MSKANVLSPQKCVNCGTVHNVGSKSIRTQDKRVICPKCKHVHIYKYVQDELVEGTPEFIKSVETVFAIVALCDVLESKIIELTDYFNFGAQNELKEVGTMCREVVKSFDSMLTNSDKHSNNFDLLKKEVEKLAKRSVKKS